MRTKFSSVGAMLVIGLLSGCGPRAEFPPETVEAYQADTALRTTTLQKCAAHAANQTPFAIEGDPAECQKAGTAQANLNYAAHMARERAANDKVANEINALAGGPSAPAKP